MPNPPFIHPSSYVDEGATLGAGTKVWHFCHVMPGAVIGENCSLGQNVFVADDVRLGNHCKVQNNVSLYTGVVCEDEVFIGPSAVFTNVRNPRSAVSRREAYAPTQLERGVTLGANCTIVCGVRLGAHAFVAAGAVITRNVPPYALMAGVPARRIGWMSAYGERLHFTAAEPTATCPGSQVCYLRYLDAATGEERIRPC